MLSMLGPYIVIGVLIAFLLFVGYSMVRPRLKGYRLTLKRVEPRKKKRVKSAKKKRKSVWIKVV